MCPLKRCRTIAAPETSGARRSSVCRKTEFSESEYRRPSMARAAFRTFVGFRAAPAMALFEMNVNAEEPRSVEIERSWIPIVFGSWLDPRVSSSGLSSRRRRNSKKWVSRFSLPLPPRRQLRQTQAANLQWHSREDAKSVAIQGQAPRRPNAAAGAGLALGHQI